jgi:hypothetical protein
MLASDVLNLAFFPKGTILMYDGTSWTDNSTLKGWYKCEGQTVDGYGVLPNLKNSFVIGYDATNTPARTGGNNTIAKTIDIATVNLPAHSHSLKNEDISITGGSHGHTLKNENISITGGLHAHSFKNENITSGGGAHSHGFTTGKADPTKAGISELTGYLSAGHENPVITNQSATGVFSFEGSSSYLGLNGGDNDNQRSYLDARHTHSGTTGNESTTGHTHTVNLNGKSTNDNTSHSHTLNLNGKSTNDSTTHTHTLNLNGKSTNTTGSGTGIALSFDNRPQYYALIYIIKVTAAGV